MNGLAGKRVIISGGCGDIGAAVAARFLEESSPRCSSVTFCPTTPAQPEC